MMKKYEVYDENDILDLDQKIDEHGNVCDLKNKLSNLNIQKDKKNILNQNNEIIYKNYDEKVLFSNFIKNKESYDENHKVSDQKKQIRSILEKINHSKKTEKEQDSFIEEENSDLYQNFIKNKTKIDNDLKSIINDLSNSEDNFQKQNSKSFQKPNYNNFSKASVRVNDEISIFSQEDEIFISIFKRIVILFLKPIMDLRFSIIDSDSEINISLFNYIDLYIKTNINFLIDCFAEEFWFYLNGQNKESNLINIKNNKDYVMFVSRSYEMFDNLSMFHFKFLNSKIDFFNSCLKNIIFFVLNINFIQNSSMNLMQFNEVHIINFLEKFFKKTFIENNLVNEFCY